MTTKKAIREGTSQAGGPPKIRWDDSNIQTIYANVCNAAGTREEIVLLFGMNQTWRPGQKEVTVQLTDRIILNPFAAKRLSLLLSNVIQNYERQFGPLNVESRRPADSIIQ